VKKKTNFVAVMLVGEIVLALILEDLPSNLMFIEIGLILVTMLYLWFLLDEASNEELVCTEFIDGIPDAMMKDPDVKIVSDTALFGVTTKGHSILYPSVDWVEITAKETNKAKEAYNLKNYDG